MFLPTTTASDDTPNAALDALDLFGIAESTGNLSKQARLRLLQIATRLRKHHYACESAALLRDGYDGSTCSGAEGGPGAIVIHYSEMEKADAAHAALCALLEP